MRYRVIAKYIGDRRYILAQDIDGLYCILVPQGMKTAVRPISALVCADVAWEDPQPRDPVPPTFWLTSMPVSVHAIWYAENARGRLHYVTKKALHRHPFQHDPAYGRDLPYDIPATADPDAVAK